MELKESDHPKVILIGGVGRTGTNILKDVLCDHSEGHGLPFETRITVDPDGIAPTISILTNSWTPFIADTAIKRLDRLLQRAGKKGFADRVAISANQLLKQKNINKNLRAYKEWELEKHFPTYWEAKNKLIEDLSSIRYRGAWPGGNSLTSPNITSSLYPPRESVIPAAQRYFDNLYKPFLEKNNANFYVDDNTYNIFFAKELLEITPNSHLIHVTRDPRDTITSFLKQRWTPNNLEDCIKLFISAITRWDDTKKNIDSAQYTEIRLEDLCNHREETINYICDRAGMNLDDRLFCRPLDKANTGRWEKDLSQPQKTLLEKKLLKWYKLQHREQKINTK